LKLIAYVLEREFGIKYNPRSLSPILKKLGFKYKKGKRTYVRDEKAVEEWVRNEGEKILKNKTRVQGAHL
jgi:transposase